MASRKPPEDTCWTVIAQAARGDRGARSFFGRAYLPVVQSFLEERWRKTPLAAEVDDATQDVFVECYRAGGPLERVDPRRQDFRGYLMGVTRNIARRCERRRQQRLAVAAGESLLATIADREQDCADRFDQEWARELMRQAVDLMHTRAAAGGAHARLRVELLRRRFIEDQSTQGIAIEWRMSANAVQKAYARAKDEFRSCLRRVVSFYAVRTAEELDDECRRLLGLLNE